MFDSEPGQKLVTGVPRKEEFKQRLVIKMMKIHDIVKEAAFKAVSFEKSVQFDDGVGAGNRCYMIWAHPDDLQRLKNSKLLVAVDGTFCIRNKV